MIYCWSWTLTNVHGYVSLLFSCTLVFELFSWFAKAFRFTILFFLLSDERFIRMDHALKRKGMSHLVVHASQAYPDVTPIAIKFPTHVCWTSTESSFIRNPCLSFEAWRSWDKYYMVSECPNLKVGHQKSHTVDIKQPCN